MCVWIISSLSCNLQIQIIISNQVVGLTSGEIIAAYISERMTCALYHPPTLLLCHSFKTKRKEDLLLPPTYLKGQCHSIRSFFFEGVPQYSCMYFTLCWKSRHGDGPKIPILSYIIELTHNNVSYFFYFRVSTAT